MPQQENNNNRQVGQYDKLLKKNLDITLLEIIRYVLGLDIVSIEKLPAGIQHTIERILDSVQLVTDANGKTYVLHIEFQTEDEKDMVYRMLEYNSMLTRKYKLPVKQYVIFLGDKKPKMKLFLNNPNHKYSFNLVLLSDVPYKVFLKSPNPEVKMLGLLANFGKKDSYKVIETIVKEVQDASKEKGDFAESGYFNQMRIFVQLRKGIEQQFNKIMITVNKFFKEENDFLYRRGEERGKELGEKLGEKRGKALGKELGEKRGKKLGEEVGEKRGKELGKEQVLRAVVGNLILNLGLSDKEAARIAEVKVDYVKKIRSELKDK